MCKLKEMFYNINLSIEYIIKFMGDLGNMVYCCVLDCYEVKHA